MAALGMSVRSLQGKNLKLTVAYDGSAYHGFQRQANAMTVQQVLEEALTALLGESIVVAGAARTDAGVHAYGQVISFRTNSRVPVERIPIAMQGMLPSDIAVIDAQEANAAFHARFAATGKLYRYRILNSPVPDPLQRSYVWQMPRTIELSEMQTALQYIVGEHHFGAFQSAGSSAKNPVRTLYDATCMRQGETLDFHFHGNGFLYHMVRNIVGTLVDVGTKKISLTDFQRIFDGRDRSKAGATAPGAGLYLLKVFYENP
jgi:tRNA pseudouridine38-40 synthase